MHTVSATRRMMPLVGSRLRASLLLLALVALVARPHGVAATRRLLVTVVDEGPQQSVPFDLPESEGVSVDLPLDDVRLVRKLSYIVHGRHRGNPVAATAPLSPAGRRAACCSWRPPLVRRHTQ